MTSITNEIQDIFDSLNTKNSTYKIKQYKNYILINGEDFLALATLNNKQLKELYIKRDNITDKFCFLKDYDIHESTIITKEKNRAFSKDKRSRLYKNNKLVKEIYTEKTISFDKNDEFIYDREYLLERTFKDGNTYIKSIDVNKKENILEENYGLVDINNKFTKLTKEEYNSLLKEIKLELKK